MAQPDDRSPEPDLTPDRPPLRRPPTALHEPLDWGLALGIAVPGFAALQLTSGQETDRVRKFVRDTAANWRLPGAPDSAAAVAAAAERAADDCDEPAAAWLALFCLKTAVLCAVVRDGSTVNWVSVPMPGRRPRSQKHGLGAIHCASTRPPSGPPSAPSAT